MTRYLQLDNDPERDPELAALLRDSASGAAAPVNWEQLGARIGQHAELPLARRRAQQRERRHGVLALAAAACLALAVGMNDLLAPAFQTSEPVLGLAAEQELDRLISGRAEADALLQAALEGPERTGSGLGS
jgi:hypothetical protein